MEELEKAIELRNSGNLKESNQLLLNLVKKYPDDAVINYQCAWSYDALGEESNAVPYYVKAINLGLSGKDLEGAYLGLGSTYRTLGEYQKSKETFSKGIQVFPDNKALQVFFSMTLYNLKEHNQAMELLLNCLIETTSDENILNYERAISFYSDKLDKVWK
ncbi:tetratricopeptide repeat protein [Cytobacillus sp. FJAT-54145]|uniref:Tetratricopeptide repeat protein n=1 Tax=Cytobacillus spartinae TaxID=3299023 RepID=A0ABW6K728_9BACI